MKLVQIRECDGKCCEESPRFPNANKTDCVYHVMSRGKESAGCTLMANPANIPDGESPVQPGQSASETFQKTCVNWPQNSPEGRGTGGCCMQWV